MIVFLFGLMAYFQTLTEELVIHVAGMEKSASGAT